MRASEARRQDVSQSDADVLPTKKWALFQMTWSPKNHWING